MARGCAIVNLMLLCLILTCIDRRFQGVNARNVTLSKVQPDDPQEGDETVQLRCNVTNLEPGDLFEWSRLVVDTKVVIQSQFGNGGYSLYTESSSENSEVRILSINGVQKDDAGVYYCKVKNSEGTVVAAAAIYLKVLYLPSAEYPSCSPNGPFTVQEGTTQQFTCTTERGSPPVSMQILRNDSLVLPRPSTSVNNSILNGSFTFDFTADDNGTIVECKILSLPLQRSCTFGPITVTMQDNLEAQFPTTVENGPTPQTDTTSGSSNTNYPSSTPSQATSNPSAPSQVSLNPSTPRQSTLNPSTPSQATLSPSTPSQRTLNPATPSQPTLNPSAPNQPTLNPSIPSQPTLNPSSQDSIIIIIVVVAVGFPFLLLILIIAVCYCCLKRKQKPRQPQVNLPLFQPTTDLVFEPQGISYHAIHQESANLDKTDMTEKDATSEGIGADKSPKPDVMLVSQSPKAAPNGKQTSSFKSDTGPSPTDVDEKNTETSTPQPGLTAGTAGPEEGQGDKLHKPTPTTGEVVYSEVSSQKRESEVSISQKCEPEVSAGHTTYADLDLSPCTSDTVPLPKDQTLYASVQSK